MDWPALVLNNGIGVTSIMLVSSSYSFWSLTECFGNLRDASFDTCCFLTCQLQKRCTILDTDLRVTIMTWNMWLMNVFKSCRIETCTASQDHTHPLKRGAKAWAESIINLYTTKRPEQQSLHTWFLEPTCWSANGIKAYMSAATSKNSAPAIRSSLLIDAEAASHV